MRQSVITNSGVARFVAPGKNNHIDLLQQKLRPLEKKKSQLFNGFPFFLAQQFKICWVKVKVKFTLEQTTKAQRGEQIYSFTLPSTSALDGVGGQRRAPAALLPGKTRYPLYRRLGGPQGRCGRVRKISPTHRDSIPRACSP